MDKEYSLGSYVCELSAAINGRRTAKFVLHEIFADQTQHQNNGISWNEEFTRQAMSTVEGMSFKAEFLDGERDVPFSHGMTGYEDGKPVFQDAVVIGFGKNPKIENVSVNGREIKALTAEAELDGLTYPHFIKWLDEQYKAQRTISGSVEILGREPYQEIVYLNDYKDIGRVPKEYIYGGYAIINVEPADKSAILLELNQKGGICMDKEISDAFTEIGSKLEALNSLEAKTTEINTVKAELATKITECNQLQTSLNEANKKIVELEAQIGDCDKKMKELETQAKKAELNAAIKDFTDADLAPVKDLIDKFNADPKSVEVNAIVQKLKATKYDSLMAEINAKKEAKKDTDVDLMFVSNRRPLDNTDYSDIF